MVELLLVVAVMTIVLVMAVPSFFNAQRVARMNGMTREVATQLRLVRQESMGQLRAMTFQYNDTNKQIVVIRHAAAGPAVLTGVNYPNNGVVVRTVPLTGGGLSAAEITYGRPAGVPIAPLGDNTSLTALTGGNLNITFQPDGSVLDAAGAPVDVALYFYNPRTPLNTAAAISVLGSAGRVKLWRYLTSANSYVE
ncbi:MAG TPA: hypothetical protein VF525_13505 [Pyrinomonadaceae bacterium]|jgi:Tfp pilus assembly protein FimT